MHSNLHNNRIVSPQLPQLKIPAKPSTPRGTANEKPLQKQIYTTIFPTKLKLGQPLAQKSVCESMHNAMEKLKKAEIVKKKAIINYNKVKSEVMSKLKSYRNGI